MPGEGFEAVVTQGKGGSVIEMTGTLNRAAKEATEAAFETASEIDGEILLDFNNVEYINSTGIALVVGVLAMARAAGREIGAVGLTEHYREVFEITRLSDFMHIYQDTSTGN